MANREASTGSVRDSRKGKGRFDLISPIGLRRLAIVYEKGGEKYGERNWEKGQPPSWYLDSALRHVNNHLEGTLPEEDHIAHAVWNLMAYMHTVELIAQDKLPKELLDDAN